MPIRVECKCGKKFGAPSKYAGKKVKCPQCSEPNVVPAPTANGSSTSAKPTSAKPTSAKPTSAKPISVKCSCGKSFAAKPELAGKTVRCPGCKKPLKVGANGKASSPARPKASPAAMADDPFADVGLAATNDGGPGRKCPECASPMGEDDILCINCGYNERLGKKMNVERPLTQEDREKAHLDKVLTGDKAEKKRGWFGRKKK